MVRLVLKPHVPAQLTGADQDCVFQLCRCCCVHAGILPFRTASCLTEDGDFQPVRAQAAVQNINGQFEPFVRRCRVIIPFGDDDTAKGICRYKRNERKRIEGCAPQEAVHADPATCATIIIVVVAAKKNEPVFAENGLSFTAWVRVVRPAPLGCRIIVFSAGTGSDQQSERSGKKRLC